MHQHVLLPVEDSAASRLAVDEVRKWPEDMRPPRLTLVHVLGILPPALLEHGGASDADEERRQEAHLAAERDRWQDARREEARPAVEGARRALAEAGWEDDRLDVAWVALIPEDDVARKLLEMARERGCDRIVVARADGDDGARVDGDVVDRIEKHVGGDVDVLVVPEK